MIVRLVLFVELYVGLCGSLPSQEADLVTRLSSGQISEEDQLGCDEL